MPANIQFVKCPKVHLWTLMLIVAAIVQFNECCILRKPILQVQSSNLSTIVAQKANDYVDVNSGSELTLICEALNISSVSAFAEKHLEWILPEFHPLYDDQPPEHVEVRESTFSNSTGTFVRSVLRVSDIQTSDVGHYSCFYRQHLIFADENLKNFPSVYVFVTDRENLFVKSIPILSAIYGRPIDLGCRPASSQTRMFLFQLNTTSRARIPLQYANTSEVALNSSKSQTGIEFNLKRGFFLANLTHDRFICRAELHQSTPYDEPISQEHSVMIHYTHGVQFSHSPEVVGHRYAFLGKNFTLSCSVEKSRSASVFLKWQLLNQSCYQNELLVSDVEPYRVRNAGNDRLRLNVTILNVTQELNNASMECSISDVSMDQRAQQVHLRVYDKPEVNIVPQEETVQIVRCNTALRFVFNIYSQPDELENLNLTWTDPTGRVLHDGDPRVTLISSYTERSLTLSGMEPTTLNNWTRKIIKATLVIESLSKMDTGNYTLWVRFPLGSNKGHDELFVASSTLDLTVLSCGLADLGANYILAAVGTCITILTMLVFIFALVNRIKVERREKRELEILSYNLLNNGTVDSRGMLKLNLDPNLPVHEQVDLLRYDPTFEVAKEDIDFGQIIGSGAFGQVHKARVFGLRKAPEAYTKLIGEENKCGITVAVKTLKNSASMDQLKSLLSELKTLTYIGRHVNIVNLLGACTANLIQGQLYVVVEYCHYGNLQQFLLRNRAKFQPILVDHDKSNAFSDESDIERKISADFGAKDRCFRSRLAKLISRSKTHLTTIDLESAVGNNNLEQEERGVVFLRRTPTGSLSEYDQVELFGGGTQNDANVASNIVLSASDKFDSSGASISVQDLYNFAYQCAAGMEYLSGRKVIHRDLAARNVLLSRGGIVKICDFGLARELAQCDYSAENYVKKNDEPLPIKWMALESLRDKIYTTKTDVWSYGVFLWELFSLGATPYPGMLVDGEFFTKLEAGYRMATPKWAPDTIYRLMLDCWQDSAKERPEFSEICAFLFAELDPAFLKTYEDVSANYVDELQDDRLNGEEEEAGVAYEQFDGLNGVNTKGENLKEINQTKPILAENLFIQRQQSRTQSLHHQEQSDYLQMNERNSNSTGVSERISKYQQSRSISIPARATTKRTASKQPLPQAGNELNYIQMERQSFC